jgi:hypothetical protein
MVTGISVMRVLIKLLSAKTFALSGSEVEGKM